MFNERWGFVILPTYTVVLTRYGTGGSYDVRSGRIMIRTDAEGGFKRESPSHTVVHEMVHIGVEQVIVQQFRLSHTEKERLVDLICSIGLGQILHDYDVSPRGDARLNDYVTRITMDNLPDAITDFVRGRSMLKVA